MKKACCYCNQEMPSVEGQPGTESDTTHGICRSCFEKEKVKVLAAFHQFTCSVCGTLKPMAALAVANVNGAESEYACADCVCKACHGRDLRCKECEGQGFKCLN